MDQAAEQELFQILEKQGRSQADTGKILKAYEFARRAHEGQFRKSEDPYIVHPLGVATMLADLSCDTETICAGLLHDVLEDCDVTPKQIKDVFGPEVTTIVEGVTKLGKFSFSSREERQAENFRKLLVAIADDVRVVLVKLADRLHNMRTLCFMNLEKQKEIAQETLEIYAPLANRFGLGRVKWELEDLSLKYLHSEDYQTIDRLLEDSGAQREGLIAEVLNQLKAELDARGINVEIFGRPKHHYSIWKKMQRQGRSFEEIFDVLAIRVIIDSSSEKDFCELGSDPDTARCYEVMGVVHQIFKPIPGRFKDYIAMPKPNSYQSLHTAVVGPKGRPVEIQIRTRRMHHLAEYGIAAHWRYKEEGVSVKADSKVDRKLAWLRQLVEWQKDLKDAQEYMTTVKMDLFTDEVFVFSPKGDVFDLPAGATPIDFAYRVHTDVGNHTIGARVNDRIVPLNTSFVNGDIVEIITAKNAHPHMDWLNFAVTHSAKSRIRNWFKKHHRDQHIAQGRQMLEAELGKVGLEEFLKSDKVKEVGRKYNLEDPLDVLAAVGYGDISVVQIASRVKDQEQAKTKARPAAEAQPAGLKAAAASKPAADKPSNISSLGGLMHHLAKCCSPVPGEEIVGVVSRGSGIAVHRADCSNLSKLDAGRHMPVDWSSERHTTYPATLKVECFDRMGVAGEILKKIADNKINLQDLRVEVHRENKTVTIHLVVEVADVGQLNHISSIIGQISDVLRVQRWDHRKRSAGDSNVTPLKKKGGTQPGRRAKK